MIYLSGGVKDVETKGRIDLKNLIITLLLVAAIVCFTVGISSRHAYVNLFNTITELCGEAMLDIESTLRDGDPMEAKYLYRFDEITSVYPDTYYKALAETLLPLADPELYEKLTPQDREALADCIQKCYGEDPDFKTLVGEAEIVVAKYIYS